MTFKIQLRDGIHLARPGHVNAICGAERITNADVREDEPDLTCEKCERLERWFKAGFDLPDALRWIGQGFTLDQALEHIEATG